MIPGSHRYMRGLGCLGATAAERERTLTERAFGVDITGTLVQHGGSGVTIGVPPSTIAALVLGSAVGVMLKKNFTGAFLGAAIGAGSATLLRWAQVSGV